MIRVENLSVKYEKASREALSNISFKIDDGEMVGLIGKNGAGKSTLLKCICKFVSPSAGQVIIDGVDIWKRDDCLQDVGILLEPVFYSHMTAYENLVYYLRIHGRERQKKQIDKLFEMVGLYENKEQKPSGFSFGMKQRLGLAMALSGEPKILILDEPFVGLDPTGVRELISILNNLVNEKKMQVIISSHQLYELSELCNRVLVLFDGQLVFDGIPDLSSRVQIRLNSDYRNGSNGMIKGLENKQLVEVEMENIDFAVRGLINEYRIESIDIKRNALERFFEE